MNIGQIYYTPVYDDFIDKFVTETYRWNGDVIDKRYLDLNLVYEDKRRCDEVTNSRNEAIKNLK